MDGNCGLASPDAAKKVGDTESRVADGDVTTDEIEDGTFPGRLPQRIDGALTDLHPSTSALNPRQHP